MSRAEVFVAWSGLDGEQRCFISLADSPAGGYRRIRFGADAPACRWAVPSICVHSPIQVDALTLAFESGCRSRS